MTLLIFGIMQVMFY